MPWNDGRSQSQEPSVQDAVGDGHAAPWVECRAEPSTSSLRMKLMAPGRWVVALRQFNAADAEPGVTALGL